MTTRTREDSEYLRSLSDLSESDGFEALVEFVRRYDSEIWQKVKLKCSTENDMAAVRDMVMSVNGLHEMIEKILVAKDMAQKEMQDLPNL